MLVKSEDDETGPILDGCLSPKTAQQKIGKNQVRPASMQSSWARSLTRWAFPKYYSKYYHEQNYSKYHLEQNYSKYHLEQRARSLTRWQFSKTFHPSLKILSLALLGALYLTHPEISNPIQTSTHIHLRWWIDPALKSQMMFCLFQDFASTLTLGARLDRNPALWGVRGLHILRGLHIFGRLIRILLNIWTFYECFQRCPFLQTLVLLPPLYWTTRREHSWQISSEIGFCNWMSQFNGFFRQLKWLLRMSLNCQLLLCTIAQVQVCIFWSAQFKRNYHMIFLSLLSRQLIRSLTRTVCKLKGFLSNILPLAAAGAVCSS